MDSRQPATAGNTIFQRVYYGLTFYIVLILHWILRPFAGNNELARRLEAQIKPKTLIDGLIDNLSGDGSRLINANESVEETFRRMIRDKHYDVAMKLAKKFDLEIDLIYKNMWVDNEKTVTLIDDCLAKVSQPLWILNECIKCVPKRLDVLKHLYRLGIDVSQSNQSKESVENLDQLNRFRATLQDYLFKIQLYEKILKSHFGDFEYSQHFDPDFYRTFRDKSCLRLAIEYAHKADIKAVLELCLNASDALFPHYLVILSNLPETMSPFNYRDLIEFILSRLKMDRSSTSNVQDEFEFEFYGENPDFLKFKIDDSVVVSKLLNAWFEFRARQILEYTSLVDYSLELLKIGIQQHDLPLKNLYAEMDLYSLLIYDGCLKTKVSFDDFEKLSITEKMNLFFDNTNWRSFSHLFERFFEKINDYTRLRMYNVTKKDLLKDFFVNLAKKNLEQCLRIFETYTMVDKTKEEIKDFKIINDPSDLIELAMACIEAYEKPEELSIAFKIMECLPDKDQVDILVGDDPEKVKRFKMVNEEADEMEYCLSIIELLREYNTEVTVKELKTIANNHDRKPMLTFIERVLNNFCKLKPEQDIFSEWKLFFLNLKDLKKKYLKLISDEELVETTVKCLLLSCDENLIQIAFNHIDLESTVSGKRLNRDKGKTILKMVAKDYLKFSDPSQDENISLAKMCLEYIHDHDQNDDEVNDELDFIRALNMLYEEFNFQVLPIKIRTMSETDVMESILSSSKDAHTKFGYILEICYLLKIFGNLSDEEREARLMMLIGQKAIEHLNYGTAIDMCKNIMDRNLTTAWRLCHDTPMMPDIDLVLPVDQKLRMLSFALAHCPEDDINVHYKLLNMIRNLKEQHINHIAELKVFINFRGEQSTAGKNV